jgi:hypothetical protein
MAASIQGSIQGFFRTPFMRQINLSDEPGSEPSGITVGTVDVPASSSRSCNNAIRHV